MGCTNSRSGVKASTSPHPQFESIDKRRVIPLTTEQMNLVRETWDVIEPNKKEIGVNVYMRFLNMNPSLKALFSDFKDISVEQINKSNPHPRRLMAAIENSVSALDDTETFASYMLEMGRRHARFNMRPSKSHSVVLRLNLIDHSLLKFKDLRNAFIISIKEFLGRHWRSEIEESWTLLFDFMTTTMAQGYSIN